MDPKELLFAVNQSPFRFVVTGLRRIYSRSFFYLIAALKTAFYLGCDGY